MTRPTNTFVTPTWLKRESIGQWLDRAGVPSTVARQATDAQIEVMADTIAQALHEAHDDDDEEDA